MIAVIFEVWPKPDKKQNYLDIAAALRPILERIDGFISIERFEEPDRARQNPLTLVLPR
jgi:heme-degrading monooxygenase HmoA